MACSGHPKPDKRKPETCYFLPVRSSRSQIRKCTFLFLRIVIISFVLLFVIISQVITACGNVSKSGFDRKTAKQNQQHGLPPKPDQLAAGRRKYGLRARASELYLKHQHHQRWQFSPLFNSGIKV